MQTSSPQRLVILGGGTAGWIAAAAFAKKLGPLLDITLVESDAIGTVGVGEATIPPIRVFHKLLGIDEQDFMRATQATFKLGIGFENWAGLGDDYLHSFGENGRGSWLCGFHAFWLSAVERGMGSELGDYCFELQAARAGRFAHAPKPDINYAYHFDASLYARYLRAMAEPLGVKRVEGKIERVEQCPQSGFVRSLWLEGERRVEGDLFVDCTGLAGLLIDKTLGVPFEDWSHWLPCDRALAVQTASMGDAIPYTRSIARSSGWQWRIPLQHRVGNGLVYSSRFQSDDFSRAELLRHVEGSLRTEPRLIRFNTGRRERAWSHNVVAIGLASGFLEPLESTSIHLIITAVTRLMQLFPFSGASEALAQRYNELTRTEIERIRDFIILHYHATEREDSSFWRYCRHMDVPDSLAHRMQVFREEGHAWQGDGELFRIDSWTQVMLGQRIRPQRWHGLPRMMPDAELHKLLEGIRGSIQGAVARMPSHQRYIDQYCRAPDHG